MRARLTTRVADGGAGPSNEGPVRPSCPARFTVPTPPHDTTFRSFALALAAVPLVAACSPNPGDWVKARWEPMAALTQRCPNLEGLVGRLALKVTTTTTAMTRSTSRWRGEHELR